jgi:hypothetical protein
MDLLSAAKADMYAFTHAIMYVTDLGTRRARLPRSSRAIAADADVALASCLAEPDYDIAGEVLLTWPMLGRRWSASAAVGFAVLASVEDRAGLLPRSGIPLGPLPSADGEEQSRYAIASAYHTAYVMGLLCAAALGPGCAPPARLAPAPRRAHGAANELMALAADLCPGAHWYKYVNELPPVTRDSAAELILHICLCQAALRRDLGTIVTALRLAERYGLLDTPACLQAAELLRRTATFAALPQPKLIVVPDGREAAAQGTAARAECPP